MTYRHHTGLKAALFIPGLLLLLSPALVAQGSAKMSLQTPAGLSKIQHFVFILKENRSFDHYFGTFPGADGATTATLSTGQVIPIGPAADQLPRDFNHSWLSAITSIDYGRMDKFDVLIGPATEACNINGDYGCFTQMSQQDIPNYFALAKYFVLSDHMFSSIHGTSLPNHLYSVAGQSGGMYDQPVLRSTGTLQLACEAEPGSTVLVMDAQGNVTAPFPCFDFDVLTDSLQAAGVSWKFYAPAGSFWNPLDAINHVRNTSLWSTNVVPDTQFVLDAATGNLPEVSWLVTSGTFSEHPSNSTCVGENWSVQQVEAVMNGPDWNSTALFLGWDDWDGLYDHLPPPQTDQYGLGPRVPMIIISPYAKSGFISHTPYEFSSYLKLVEERYNLVPLTQRDAAASDMLDSFNFNQSPLPPLSLSTRSCSPASTKSLTFMPQLVGKASPPKSVTLTNYASTTLTISKVAISGADYSQSNNCRVLPPPSPGPHSCVVSVTFTPTTSGTRTGTLTITDSDPSSPQVTSLNGIGTNVSLSTPLLDFGTQAVSRTTPAKTAMLTNNGSTTLNLTSIVATGDYSETNNCGSSLSSGGTCTVTVTFTPTTPGVRYGTVTITDDDGSGSQVLNLTGIGTFITIAPRSLNFGTQALGSISSPKAVTLTNNGSSPLAISGIQLVGSMNQIELNYAQTNNCGNSLAAGASCKIKVTFSPTVPLVSAGSLLIFNSEATSPKIATFSGVGLANPVPSISLPLVPGSIIPGSSSFTLTVNGSNFVSGATVKWNGSSLNTTFISQSTLTATVPASNVSSPKTAVITVVNGTPGGGVSNAVFFPVVVPVASVNLNESDVASTSTPVAVIVGDFDNNGILDLAVVNSGNNSITILLGNGDGTFALESSLPTGASPVAATIGDFNNDGKQDLATANTTDNTVTILLGNGDGTFTAASGSPVAVGIGPVALSTGDFNADGRVDLVVINNVESIASVLLGNGDGTFLETPAGGDTGLGPISVAVADFNHDNYLDLAIVNQKDTTVGIRPGAGDGTFTTIANFTVGHGPTSVVTADFNADGELDLAILNQADNSISISLGNGDGTFTQQSTLPTANGPSSLVTGDFNGDGKLDLATANQSTNSVSILLGNSDGTFQAHTDYPVTAAPNSLATGDFDGNGSLDLAVTSGTAGTTSILLQGHGSHTP